MMRLLATLIFAAGLIYHHLDRRLYFYGKSKLEIYQPLPLKIRPAYWGFEYGNLGFVLVDEFDFTLVAKGNRYESSTMIVDEIKKYGFTDEELFVVVGDSLGQEHVLKFSEKNASRIGVSFDGQEDLSGLEWIDIEGSEGEVRTLELARSYILIFLIILILVAGYNIVRRRRN